MDPVEVIQLAFAGTTVLIFGRIGLALARFVERRLAGTQGAQPEAESRLRAVEDECTLLRQEMSELQERQDFAERFLQGPGRELLPKAESPERRPITPH